MGGDDAPDPNVAGAAAAANEGLHVLLVGDEAILHDSIRKLGGLPPTVHVHHASEVVEMDDAPRSALRRKKDSSLRVAFELARNGQADATGEFMFGVQRAYRIKNGKIGELHRGVTLSGKAFDVLQTVDAVSNEFLWDLGSGHCGKGQLAKVDAGGYISYG